MELGKLVSANQDYPKSAQQQRKQLWKLQLPASIPGVNPIKINMLAPTYQLTGG
jgi:hypothetical protein